MQQMKCFSDCNWDKYAGVKKFNNWLREHPSYKVESVNVVPRKEQCDFYVIVDIPDEEEANHE